MDKLQKKFYNDNFKSSLVLPDRAKQRVKDKIFANLNTTTQVVQISFWQKFASYLPKSYAIIPIGLLLFVAGTTTASAHALPGDTLYPVKRQIENIRVAITPGQEAKLEVKLNLAKERLNEFEALDEKNNESPNQDSPLRLQNQTQNNINDSTNTTYKVHVNNSDEESEHSQHRVEAQKEANKALDFLKQTQQNFEDQGRNQKAQEVENQINDYKNQLHNRVQKEDSGSQEDQNDSEQRNENINGNVQRNRDEANRSSDNNNENSGGH